MNLIEQFPDISEKVRAKSKIKKRKSITRINRGAQAHYEEKTNAGYPEAALRRWHLKMLFLIAVSVGITYYALMNRSLFMG